MQYTVDVIVFARNLRSIESRLRKAVRDAGGRSVDLESSEISGGDRLVVLTVRIPDTRMLHDVVRAAEGVKGAAVREVKAPRPVPDF